MRNGRELLNIHTELVDGAPLATLAAGFQARTRNSRKLSEPVACVVSVSSDGVRLKYTSTDEVQARVRERIVTGVKRQEHNDELFRQNDDLLDVPEQVVKQLRSQLLHEKEQMDKFYKAALEDIMPRLVLRVMEGEEVNYSHEFNNALNKELKLLGEQLYAASLQLDSFVDFGYALNLAVGSLTCDVTFLTSRARGSGRVIEFDGSHLVLYMRLGEVRKAVTEWLEAVQYLAAKFPVQPEAGI